MKAIILAAGLGSRLSQVTSGRPKCLLELHGKAILLHQLDLLATCGITEVTIGSKALI
jgi:choline kinase